MPIALERSDSNAVSQCITIVSMRKSTLGERWISESTTGIWVCRGLGQILYRSVQRNDNIFEPFFRSKSKMHLSQRY